MKNIALDWPVNPYLVKATELPITAPYLFWLRLK